MIKRKITLAIILILVLTMPILAACSSQSAANTGNGKNINTTVKQTYIEAQVSSNTVTIPLSAVDRYSNVNFRVDTATDYFMFMAYEYGDKTYVRANICVPCGSESYTLKNGILVCDSCGTQFDAQTGSGVGGVAACKSYPKQPVTYQVIDGNIVMKWSDMSAAYQKTLNRG